MKTFIYHILIKYYYLSWKLNLVKMGKQMMEKDYENE